jgi:fucose permease
MTAPEVAQSPPCMPPWFGQECSILKPTFQRSRATWLAYLLIAFYGFMLNSLGPITPLLKREMGLTYAVSSLHFTAFAAGILLVGLFGHRVIRRLGIRRSLWTGAWGLSVGVLVLIAGRTPALTLPASLVMGSVGSLLLILVPSSLSEEHGKHCAVALSEANVVASSVSATAPLLVGWLAGTAAGWRLGLGLAALAPAGLFLSLGRTPVFADTSERATDSTLKPQPLPRLFWYYWAGLVLSVSVEFCMLSWSGDFLARELGMSPARGSQMTSLFLVGMVMGRLAGSRIVQRLAAPRLLLGSILLAAGGFLLFWRTGTRLPALTGLFLTGLGVASLYPILLSLALGTSRGQAVQASARATLASGLAILASPLILGSIADALGIARAYGIVAVFLAIVFIVVLVAENGQGLRSPQRG